MANLFEIRGDIEWIMNNAIDPETGEIAEEYIEQLETLELERSEKIENIGCYIKNLASDAEALKAEAKVMTERAKRAERLADSLKRYLTAALDGEKFNSTRCAISWRRSVSVEIDEAEIPELPEQYIRTKTTIEPDKTAIKDALKAGEIIEGCRLVERNNISVK